MWWFVWMFLYLFVGALITALMERMTAKKLGLTSDDLDLQKLAVIAASIALWPLLIFVIFVILFAYWSEIEPKKEIKP